MWTGSLPTMIYFDDCKFYEVSRVILMILRHRPTRILPPRCCGHALVVEDNCCDFSVPLDLHLVHLILFDYIDCCSYISLLIQIIAHTDRCTYVILPIYIAAPIYHCLYRSLLVNNTAHIDRCLYMILLMHIAAQIDRCVYRSLVMYNTAYIDSAHTYRCL